MQESHDAKPNKRSPTTHPTHFDPLNLGIVTQHSQYSRACIYSKYYTDIYILKARSRPSTKTGLDFEFTNIIQPTKSSKDLRRNHKIILMLTPSILLYQIGIQYFVPQISSAFKE